MHPCPSKGPLGSRIMSGVCSRGGFFPLLLLFLTAQTYLEEILRFIKDDVYSEVEMR